MTIATTEQTNIDTVPAFIEAFWNQHNLNSVGQFLASGYVDHAYSPPTVDGLKGTAGELAAALPDNHCTIEDLIAQGDKVIARMTLRGTHGGPFRGAPPTGNPVEVNVYRTYRLADGKIAEHWALLDTATLLRQIAAQPSAENACKR